VVPDLFYRQTFGKKPRGAGMTQRVAAAMDSIDSKYNKSAISDITNTACLQRSTGRLQAEKYFRPR
jgi:hypothetical protein